MSLITTHDGTTIIVHPVAGTISARSRDAAVAELRRRLAERNPA